MRFLAPLLVLALSGPAMYLAVRDGHHWGGDFAVYLNQAQNLLEGRPLNETHYAVTPEAALNHPASYPPLPSVLLAPVLAGVGLNYYALKLYLAFFAWLGMPIWYALGRRMGLPAAAAAICTLLFAWGAQMSSLLDSIGSDGVFLFVSPLALLLILELEARGWTSARPWTSAILVTAALMAAYSIRSVALAFFVGFGLREAWIALKSRRPRLFGVVSVALLFACLILYSVFVYNSGKAYGVQFSLDRNLLIRDVVFYSRMAAPLWSPAPAPMRYLLAGLALGLAGWAIWRRGLATIVEPYLLVFLGVLIVYTGNCDFRYSAPLLPLVLFLAAWGILDLAKHLGPSFTWLPVGLAALAITASAFGLRAIDRSPVTEGVTKAAFLQTVDFLRQTPPGGLILSWNPRLFGFYARHTSALYPQNGAALSSVGPGDPRLLVIYDGHTIDREKLGRYLEGPAAAQLELVFRNAEFRVYRVAR